MKATLRPTRAEYYQRSGGPWDGATLDDLSRARPHGRGLTVVDGDRRLGPADLDRAVAGLAGALRGRGVRHRQPVAFQLPTGADAVLLFRACWRLGAVAVPLHHHLGAEETAALVGRVDPVLTLAAPGMALAEQGALPIAGPDGGWFAEALAGGAGTADGRGPEDASDLAVLLFTSGSTGAPKGVLHTHQALASKMRSMIPIHGLGPDDAVLVPLPMAHISGLLNGILVPTAAGMTSVLMPRWEPARALDLMEAERVSFLGGPPTLATDLMALEQFTPARVAAMRVISSGGMGVSPAFVQAATEAFGAQVKRTYGSTEIPTITTCGPLGEGTTAEHGSGTDGRTFGDSQVRTVDPVTGEDVPPGEPGEVWCRGPEMFAGYLDEEDTLATTTGGWFRTGDLGRIDGEGWLRIVGRLKDIIIRGGENISTAEVEHVLEEHPGVHRAVVVGRPDDRLGERVAAFVEGSPDFDLAACQAWFESKGVARFKTPESVTHLEAIPLLPAGKPDRARLRALAGASTDGGTA